jgi:muramoyltetrapeptide carboxypeptidase
MIIKPYQLIEGDTIGILSPSFVLKQEVIQPSLEKLKEKGFKIRIAKNAFKDTFGYAATPEERAEDFNNMVLDNEVKMLLFGGGEVCNEILPLLDFSLINKNPKIICSYSDSTTLLNAITMLSKVVTFYGQSLRTFLDLTDYNYQCFQTAFCNNDIRTFKSNSKWEIIREGKCEGTLVGGYLANLALMLNGNYFKYDNDRKYILFIEDHIRFSSPAVVSKYFSHIEQSGFINCVTGLIFGHYSEEASPILNSILLRLASKYKIPTVKCDDFGHGINNAIIPMGINAEIDTERCSLSYKESFLNCVK